MRENARPTATAPAVVSKIDKIKDFVSSHMAGEAGSHRANGDRAELLLVARSPDSPVARAVAAAVAGARDKVSLQVIFFVGLATDALAVSDCDVAMYADTVAVIDAARMMDVHEQLVVDGTAVWFGDSLRREPTKCDAFESFHKDSAEASRNARRAFTQLWSHATPLTVSSTAAGLQNENGILGMAAAIDSGLSSEAGTSSVAKPN